MALGEFGEVARVAGQAVKAQDRRPVGCARIIAIMELAARRGRRNSDLHSAAASAVRCHRATPAARRWLIAFGNPVGIRVVPDGEAQPEEDVGAHHCPGEHVELLVGEAALDLALVARSGEPRGDAGRGRLIMLAIGSRFDELGLVDDAIDVAVVAGEAKEGRQRAPFAIQRVARARQGRADIVAHLRRHVADQRLEQRLLDSK